MPLHIDDVDLLEQPTVSSGPRMLPIDAIDEDTLQPRLEFDDEALAELAESIRQRGIRQPVSVRRSQGHPERWTLNFGARRLRASRMAGLTEVPAFEDDTADSFDQLMENEQRSPLTPLEVALFIKRHLNAGMSKADIARRMAKSKAYVTMHCALIDAPDWLMDLYRTGSCRRIRDLYEMRMAGHPPAIRTGAEDAVHSPAPERTAPVHPGSTAEASAFAFASPPDPDAFRKQQKASPEPCSEASVPPPGNSTAYGARSGRHHPLQKVVALCDRLEAAVRMLNAGGRDEADRSAVRQRLIALLENL